MSDTTDTTTDTKSDSTADATTATDAAKSDTSASDTDAAKDWQSEAEKWKAFARKHEDAAKANADKAKRFDEFEESQKTEQQKLTDKLAAAEKRATDLEIAKIRAEVAADKGIPASLLSGNSLEEFEASADALLAFRGEKPKPDFGGGSKGDDVSSKPGTVADLDNQIAAATTANNFQLAIALRQERSALIANEKKS